MLTDTACQEFRQWGQLASSPCCLDLNWKARRLEEGALRDDVDYQLGVSFSSHEPPHATSHLDWFGLVSQLGRWVGRESIPDGKLYHLS